MTVHFRRLVAGAAHRVGAFGMRGAGRDRAIDHDLHGPADQRAQAAARDLQLGLHQRVAALLLHGQRDVVLQLGGRRARLLGIHKHAHVREAALIHEVNQLLELRVGLARVAHDEGGADGPARQLGRDAVQQGHRVALAQAAAHVDEQAVADVLQGHVDIGAEARVGGQGVQHLVAQEAREGVHEAEPGVGLDPGQRAQQGGQAQLAVVVAPVAGAVLGDQPDLARAGVQQLARLGHDVLHGPADLHAADVGDGAELAEVGAALGDLQVGQVGRADAQAGRGQELVVALGEGARRPGQPGAAFVQHLHRHALRGRRGGRLAHRPGGQPAAQLGQARVVLEPDGGIGLVQKGIQLGGALGALHQAAQRHHRLQRAGFLQPLQLLQHPG